MPDFKKTVNGKDFWFHLEEGEKEYFFKVACENHSFEMCEVSKDAWKISTEVPKWINELEANLSTEIISHSHIIDIEILKANVEHLKWELVQGIPDYDR